MAKKPRLTKAQKQQQMIDQAVAAALAKVNPPAPAPAPTPPVDEAAVAREKHQRKIAAVHEAARIARRANVPDDVVEELQAKAAELEKA